MINTVPIMPSAPPLALCCQMAQVSYLSWTQIADRVNGFGLHCTLVKTVPDTDTQWFHAIAQEYVILVFRGTQSIQNAFTDAQISQTDIGGSRGMVHSGALKAYQSAGVPWQQLGNKPLFIIGHSLGGWLADFAAADYITQRPDAKLGLRTFGCPRPGNQVFANFINAEVIDHIRCVHDNDIVPNLLWLPLLNYYHPGSLLHINDDGSIIPPIARWWDKLWHLDRAVIADFNGDAIAEHHIATYQSCINNWQLRGAP